MKRIIGIPEAIFGFFREIIQEIKLVEFPSRSETFRKTWAVLGFSFLIAFFLFALDAIFIALRNALTNITL